MYWYFDWSMVSVYGLCAEIKRHRKYGILVYIHAKFQWHSSRITLIWQRKYFFNEMKERKKIKGGIAHLQINMLIKLVRALNSLKTNK